MSITLFYGDWNHAGDSLATLLSSIKYIDAEKLLDGLSNMVSPPPVMEDSAVKWFDSLTNLPSEAVVVAVQEFFHLGWVWNQIGPCTGLVFDDLLALLYKVMQVLVETPGDLRLMESLVQKGIRWPDRFGFMLERGRIGGGNVIRALDRATEIMKYSEPAVHEALIDFSLETGWYLLTKDDLPVWRSIGRSGESLYRKMRGFTIPMESIRALAGFLGKLEEAERLQDLLDDAMKVVITDISGNISPEEMENVLGKLSEPALKALKRRAERNICLDIISLPVMESGSPLEYGHSIAEMMLFTGVGVAFYNCFREAYDILRNTEDNQKILLLSKLVLERSGVEYLSSRKTEFFMDFLPVALLFLEDKTSMAEMRRVVNSIGRLMDSVLSQEDPESIITNLKSYLTDVEADRDKLLTSLILLIRSARGINFQEILERSEVFGGILELLEFDYRRRLLEGEQTDWLTPLAEDSIESARVVLSTLEKLNKEDLRGRFMDKVMAPLLQETDTDDPVFTELISSGVSTYNRDMSIEQLRKEETALLGKLFRAEDRSKALKKTMENLLRIPGIEERNASDLIHAARILCETLSQQAVWIEKTGHRIFSKFLTFGLTAFVKTLVEYPDIAERITGCFMRNIVDTIIPSKETEDSDVALWQLKTASMFFGKIIPLTTELNVDNPNSLTGYLSELSELTVTSKHGEPAGAPFLSWMSHRLESELLDEFARKLSDESPYRKFDESFNALRLMEVWRKIRDASSDIMNDMMDSLQLLATTPLFRQILLREGRKLIEGFIENGCRSIMTSGGTDRGSKDDIEEFRRLTEGHDPVEVIRIMEDGGDEKSRQAIPEEIVSFFGRQPCPPGQNVCRCWRNKVFSTFENILLDILLLCTDKKSLEQIELIIDEFVQIIGYLGTDVDFKPEIVLTALEKSLSRSDGGRPMTVEMAIKNLDKNVYKLMWLRKATRKAAESVSGYIPGRKISIRLFDRISREESAKEQILFMKNFGRIFAALESEIMKRKPTEIKSARSALDHIWIFNPEAAKPSSVVDTARDAVETVTQFFIEISTRTGAVSATEAGAISLGMRRKYRDNANTVAILIKWTQDSTRSDLLSLVEAHQPLLEAVSRDSELIQMIDTLWSNGKARLYIRSLADRPDKLKKSLERFIGASGLGSNDGLQYV
ncbi:MAG: hypothetical protein JXA64_11005 [Candidatus Fermentibacteraceae bacterium]|nr:hypothetical protein [Candidatus Fermentibacteraceae bacterium]MBN2609633.1 hypothetical protein [Candidatus Fermentibacteraceae bacterium]